MDRDNEPNDRVAISTKIEGTFKKGEGLTCNGCGGGFILEEEGGVAGDFGILPIAFCPTCLSCCVDMVHQMYPCPACELKFEEAYEKVNGDGDEGEETVQTGEQAGKQTELYEDGQAGVDEISGE